MSYQTIPLLAGVPYRVEVAGQLFLLDSPGVAGGVDVSLVRNGTPGPTMPNRRTAFRHVAAFDAVILTAAVNTNVGFFISFDDVQLGIADGSAVSVPGGIKVTNDASAPIPVNFTGTVSPVLGSVKVTNDSTAPVPTAGTVTNTDAQAIPVTQKAGATFSVSGVLTNTDAQAVPVVQKVGTVLTTQAEKLATLVDHNSAVIGTGAAQLLINDTTYKRLRVKNASATARVAIGGSAVTMANAAIILEPGDMWTEGDAAGAAWYATSDTAGADVRVMGVK